MADRERFQMHCRFCHKTLEGDSGTEARLKVDEHELVCPKNPSMHIAALPAPIPNSSRPIWEMVIDDMRGRDIHGRRTYGTPLQAGNGRDGLIDAYQECLDLCVYLKKEIVEREQANVHTSKA